MVLRRLLSYLKPYQKKLWIAFGALWIATAADVFIPVIVSRFIDHSLMTRQFDLETLWWYGGTFIVLQVISPLLLYYQAISFHQVAQWIVRQLRIDVFSKVQMLGIAFFDRTPTGSLVSRITNDTEAVKDLYVSVLSVFLQSFILILGVVVAMFSLDVKLASYCLLLLPIIFLLMQIYRHFSFKIYHVIRSKLSQMNAKLNESIQGMSMIQVLRQEARLRKEFAMLNREHYQAALSQVKLHGLLARPVTALLSLAAIVLVFNYFGWNSLAGGAVKVGVLYGFLNLLDRMFEPINQMMMQLSQLQQAVVSAERVFTLLDQTAYAPQKEGENHPSIEKGEIQFDQVTFSYDGENDVLKNISFTVKPGQTVAFVGHTGSGKSSIIQLLMRFYPVRQGTIRIDGVPLMRYDEKELRSNMGLVLQDSFLFFGDIKSNIRMNNEEISEDKVREAARFVQAASFIEKLPRGYDEPVMERGANLSSGQRQLLSFARTMAYDPKILILDEATASVDTETEEAIQRALKKMQEGRTTIVIAHRLSTIQEADLILVLHRGEIIEQGTHQQLLAKKGRYYQMYLLQTQGEAMAK